MQLTATFESWFLSDGTYPPLHGGQIVNLAFQLQPEDLREVPGGDHVFEAIVDAHYRVRGTVLRVYASEDPPVAVVECRGFRFYVEASQVEGWRVGMIVEGEGRLGLDYYVWSESLVDRYTDAPDLFYPLRVTRIRRVSAPESFVSRSEHGLAAPTTVDLSEVAAEQIEEVETMERRNVQRPDAPPSEVIASYVPYFFVVDFDDDGVPRENVPRTFQ
jgi:hypothetical protein